MFGVYRLEANVSYTLRSPCCMSRTAHCSQNLKSQFGQLHFTSLRAVYMSREAL